MAYFNIPVQATPDYADGDAIGSLITLPNVVVRSGGVGYITRLQLRSLISIGVQMFVHLFEGVPTNTTITDNGALTIHTNDKSKLIKSIAIASADWVAPKGASPYYTVELVDAANGRGAIAFDLLNGRNLTLLPEADGAINFSSTGDLAGYIVVESSNAA